MPDVTATTCRIGLNYTPSRHWYYCWNDWDARSIAADLGAIAELGADHIRLQLIWPYFQPNPTYVSEAHLDRLAELMDIAENNGLDVLVAVLTGWLSGYFFLPSRTKRRDPFVRRDVIESEKQLFARVIEAVGDRPNFMGIDVGNEINCLDNSLPQELGDAWGREMAPYVRGLMSRGVLVNGIDHGPCVGGLVFSMEHLAGDYDAFCLHTWPKFTGALHRGPLDAPPSLNLAAFFTQLAKLFCPQGRPIWIQEFGACDTWGTPDQQAAFMTASIDRGVRAGASVFTWWCSHDKTRDLKFKEDEYQYGLLTPDNEPKPLAETFRRLAGQYRGKPLSPEGGDVDVRIPVSRSFRPAYTQTVPKQEHALQQTHSTTWQLYDRYLAAVADGKRPLLVWE